MMASVQVKPSEDTYALLMSMHQDNFDRVEDIVTYPLAFVGIWLLAYRFVAVP